MSVHEGTVHRWRISTRRGRARCADQSASEDAFIEVPTRRRRCRARRPRRAATFEQTWRDIKPGKRAEILFAIARAIRDNAEELAQLDVKSVGNPSATRATR
jgi:acyl-CoA reductase-like NAD-dependent aldehyde dehydrogenase